jgi:hypothetical protein
MFGFFVNGNFKGFWSNKVNDKFADLTIQKMKWVPSSVTLVYYQGLQESELRNTEASIDEVKIYRDETVEGIGGEGESVYTTQKVLIKTIESDKFMINGVMILLC